jgi:hypothetical protein
LQADHDLSNVRHSRPRNPAVGGTLILKKQVLPLIIQFFTSFKPVFVPMLSFSAVGLQTLGACCCLNPAPPPACAFWRLLTSGALNSGTRLTMGLFSSSKNSRVDPGVSERDGDVVEKGVVTNTEDNTQALGTTALEIDPEQEKRVRRKMDIHLVPLTMVLYLLAFLDRSNIG